MVLSEIKYNDTNQFSKLFVDYTEQKDNLRKLISEYPKIENFKKQIKVKSEILICFYTNKDNIYISNNYYGPQY